MDRENAVNIDEPLRQRELEENKRQQQRQIQFRIAAECVAKAFSDIPAVCKIRLFGSVAVPLEKEIPRFREFRRAHIAVWHECKDVDLAVWIDDLGELKRLQNARRRALNDLSARRNISLAHHQVDVWLFGPESDQCLGRLCCSPTCPQDKPECHVPGCGDTQFLQKADGFDLRPEALSSERSAVLYDRKAAQGNGSPAVEILF